MTTNTQTTTPPAPSVTASGGKTRLPLRTWSLELARRWNGGTYSVFVLHGNIFDVFPVQNGAAIDYVPLKTFLVQRLFPERACVVFLSGWRFMIRSRTPPFINKARPAISCAWRRSCADFS